MADHTPGPWSAQEYVVRGADGSLLFDVAGKYTTVSEDVANAALAAAAPDLLRAGKYIAVKLAEAYRIAKCDPAECEAIADFMLAVAKAEGRQ